MDAATMNPTRFLCAIFCVGMLLSCASRRSPVVIGESIDLHSGVLKEVRRIFVSLPSNYDASADRYAVLYLLDGEAHFTHVAALTRYLAAVGDVPPLIVVGVETTDRVRDYTPPPVRLPPDLTEERVGGADRFMEFLDRELIPFVDRRFRTQPYRMLMGHSLGGLFTVRALWSNSCLFRALIAVDPSMPWGGAAGVREAEKALAGNRSLCVHDLHFASNEAWAANHDFADYLERVKPDALRLYHVRSPETHFSLGQSAIHGALWTIFADYRLPQDFPYDSAAAMDEHYSRASVRYGFRVPIPEMVFTSVGHALLERGTTAEALAVFQRSLEAYPQTPRAYGSLGDAYKALGDTANAMRAYEQAIETAERRRAQLHLLPVYRSEIAQLRTKR